MEGDRARALFEEASKLGASERKAWIEKVVKGDPELLAQVRAQLSARARALLWTEEESEPELARKDALRDSSSVPPNIPERIDDYSVLSLLGEGGMGWVLEARQEHSERRVALKVLKSPLVGEEVRRRFELEGLVLGRLHHPAIAEIYAAGSADLGAGLEVPYFAMELVENALPITGYASIHELDLEARLELFCAVVDGVEYGHQHGVVHRDLKPANVLVDGTGSVRIIDFGLARVIDDEGSLLSRSTRSGQITGTPQYMSPEQFLGDLTSRAALSDVYALGVLLFELMSGELPYDLTNKSIVRIADTVRRVAPRRLSHTSRGSQSGLTSRTDLDTVIGKAMAKAPDRRYESAGALAADVRRVLRREPIHARPASALYQAREFAKRNGALVGAIIAVIVALALGLAATLLANAEVRRERSVALNEAYRASLRAASLSFLNGDNTEGDSYLTSVPDEQRDWVWSLLAARVEAPRLPIRSRAFAFRSESILRTFESDQVVEWDLESGARTTLFSLELDEHTQRTCLTPDGALLMVNDATHLQVLDATTGQELAKFAARNALFGARTVAAWTNDRLAYQRLGTLRVMELRTGRELVSLSLHRGTDVLAISSDGKLVAVTNPDEGLHVIDLEAQAPLAEFPPRGYTPWHAAFSPDGLRLATTEGNQWTAAKFDPEVIVWDVSTGEPAFEHNQRVPGYTHRLTFSADGRRLAVCTEQRVLLVRPDTFEVEQVLTGLSGDVRHVAFSPEGSMLAGFQGFGKSPKFLWNDAPGMIWNAGDPNTLRGHASYVYPVAFSPDGRLVASGGWDGIAGVRGAVRLWDAESGAQVAAWGDDDWIVYSLDFLADGSALLVAGRLGDELGLRVLELEPRTTPREFPGAYRTLAVHPSGETVLGLLPKLVASKDAGENAEPKLGSIVMIDLASGESRVGPPHACTRAKPSPAFSPNGKLVASAYRDDSILIWDLESLEHQVELRGHTDDVAAFEFSADGRRLVSASSDDTVKIWDVSTGEALACLRGPKSDAMCARFSPHADHVIAGYYDGKIRIWDIAEQEVLALLVGHHDYVFSLAISPDGERMVSGSGDHSVRVWRTDSPTALREAKAERRRLATDLAPAVRHAFHELEEHAAVNERLRTEYSNRELEVALQLALAEALRRSEE